jgi:phage/plasmid-associated DNA primase
LIFACNKLPRSSDNSVGFWSRWILINFPFRFVDEEELKTLSEEEQKICKIRKNDIVSSLVSQEELSGLLNWALDGLDKLLEKGHFTYTTSNKNIQDRWIKAADSFASFCSECLCEEYGTYIMKDELRKIYNKYCRTNKIEQVGDKAIKNYLTKEMGVSEFREQNIIREYLWKNISFKENTKKTYDFGILSTFSEDINTQEVANNQANPLNHLISITFKSKNLENIEYKNGGFPSYPSYLIKIKEIIAKIPENNADLLISLFGIEILDKLVEKGDLFLKDSNTYKVV